LTCNEPIDADLFPQIPRDTAKVAGFIFGRSNFYMIVGDHANRLFYGFQWQDSFTRVDNPRRTLAMLYLITIFQLMENLPDHSAADAIRNRVDWKYALHLPLNFTGQEKPLFCDFRQWMLIEPSRQQDLKNLVSRLSHYLQAMGRQPFILSTDQSLGNICLISRLEVVYKSLSQAYEALATQYAHLLQEISLPHWSAPYSDPKQNLNLKADRSDQETFAISIGADGFHLLEAISACGIPELADLPEIKTLGQIWQGQYAIVDGKALWRKDACAHCLLSPRNHFCKDLLTNTNRRAYES
jgi:transposase